MTDHAETTLPVLTFTAAGAEGDAPGLGRLVIDEDQGASQAWVVWGIRSKNLTLALTDRLFYQAEAQTLLGAGAATSTAMSGYSGSGTVLANALSTSPTAIVSTQMTTAALTSVTGSASTDIFTKSSHGLTNDTRVRLSSLSGGSGLSTGVDYYVVNASTGFQLSLTRGGSPVALGSTVSSVTVTPQKHLTHVGAYRMFGLWGVPLGNVGTVSCALEWGVGDFRTFTTNPSTYLTSDRSSGGTAQAGKYLVDHGIVRIPDGSYQWEGRFLAASSSGTSDGVHLDYYFLVPIDEGYGEVCSGAHFATATSYTARDEFGSSGALKDAALATGGNWRLPTAGGSPSHPNTVDFSQSGGYAQRTASSDDSTDIRHGRWLYADGTSGTTQRAIAGVNVPSSAYTGVIARGVDRDTFLACVVTWSHIKLYLAAGGAPTTLTSVSHSLTAGTNVPLALTALADGYYAIELSGTQIAAGYDAALATGGALATGYTGIIDWNPYNDATLSRIAWFYTYTPATDAAVFASQSLEIASDHVEREDAGGVFLSPARPYYGDMLTVPAAGQEGRQVEVIVKASRMNPRTATGQYIDDISAKLFVTPRGLVV